MLHITKKNQRKCINKSIQNPFNLTQFGEQTKTETQDVLFNIPVQSTPRRCELLSRSRQTLWPWLSRWAQGSSDPSVGDASHPACCFLTGLSRESGGPEEAVRWPRPARITSLSFLTAFQAHWAPCSSCCLEWRDSWPRAYFTNDNKKKPFCSSHIRCETKIGRIMFLPYE